MTDFWFNHFNIYIGKDSDQWYTTSYERDAIRKHALGKFRDLLLATATSPAMMVYLDNWQSIGPDSLANGVNPANPNSKKGNRGLNENYGREGHGAPHRRSQRRLHPGRCHRTLRHPHRLDSRPSQPGRTLSIRSGRSTSPVLSSGLATPSRSHQRSSPSDDMREGMEALTLLAADPHTAHFISWTCPALRRRRPAAGSRRPHGSYLSLHGWRHQSHPPHSGPVTRVQLQKVLSQQGQNSDGVSRLRVSAPQRPIPLTQALSSTPSTPWVCASTTRSHPPATTSQRITG